MVQNKDVEQQTHEDNENKQAETKGLAEYTEIVYMTPEEAMFRRTEGGILTLVFTDKEYDRVSVNRAFPFSLGDFYLSVRDSEGKEIGIIRNLEEFPESARELIKEELEWVYYSPKITRILSVKEEFGYSYWDVETDRGIKRFTVRGTSENVISVTETRLLIIDIDGNRFDISDIRDLDPKSFKMIDSLL
jgi:hypothetical protein